MVPGSTRITGKSGGSTCTRPPAPLLIPEIEKESNQTFEVIFGIGKKDVVVGLDKMGICTSLGMEPVGSKDFGRY